MDARRAVGAAKRRGDAEAERSARAAVDAAKRALGERGPVWWSDGAPDFNRRPVGSTPYADWFAGLVMQGHADGAAGASLAAEAGASGSRGPGRTAPSD